MVGDATATLGFCWTRGGKVIAGVVVVTSASGSVLMELTVSLLGAPVVAGASVVVDAVGDIVAL